MVSVALRAGSRRWRLDLSTFGYTAVLGLIGIGVLYPVLLVLLNSFQTSRPGQPVTFSLDAWQVALSDPGMLSAVWNTIAITAARQGISFPIAIVIAWILARTDVPGARWFEFAFWIAFFLPALPVTLGWILLLDPEYGLLNRAVTLLPFLDLEKGPFNIYSFWGIVWVHLAQSTIAVKVMLLTPAFRNLDASLEEASHVAGSSTLGTLVRVVVPIMTPVILVAVLLSVIFSLQAFEIEAVLGPPVQLFIFSTKIYRLIHQEPPLYAAATALSSIILGLMLPLIFAQRWFTSKRSYTTMGGQYRAAKIRLRKWKAPVVVGLSAVVTITMVVPFVLLVTGTFMRLFGFFDLANPWTTAHWDRVLNDAIFKTSFWNTVFLGGATAAVAITLFSLIAYIAVRTRYVGRGALDFMSWFPSALPGIILGLGLVWFFLGSPLFRPLYGTMAALVIATVISTMTLGVQIIKANLAQFGLELEEAARVAGGGWFHTFWHIVLPLLAPVLLMVGAVSFISAARNVSTVALLATSNTRPLSLLQLDFMVEGRYEAAAVVGVIVVVLTTGIALVARILGLRVAVQD